MQTLQSSGAWHFLWPINFLSVFIFGRMLHPWLSHMSTMFCLKKIILWKRLQDHILLRTPLKQTQPWDPCSLATQWMLPTLLIGLAKVTGKYNYFLIHWSGNLSFFFFFERFLILYKYDSKMTSNMKIEGSKYENLLVNIMELHVARRIGI